MVEALREADAWGSRALRADEEEAVIVTYILPASFSDSHRRRLFF